MIWQMRLSLVLALLAWYLTWWRLRRLRRELRELAEGADRQAQGELDFHLPTAGLSGEPAELAGVVNRAARAMALQIRGLDERRAELDALLTGLRDGVLALDRQGRVRSCNPAAARLLGLGAQPLGTRLDDLEWSRPLQLALREGWLSPGLERELVLDSGPVREVRLWTMPLPTPLRNREALLLAVISDVGAQNQAERLRRDFVANVSHELKTPVTSIRGYVETLLDGTAGDPETARRFLKVIERQAGRLDAIIEDLLDLSRIERQELEGGPARQELALEPLLRGLLEDHQPQARQAGVTLALDLAPELPALIKADAALLERALANLLGNALRYGRTGSDVLLRAASKSREQGPGLRLEVVDQGQGISPEHLPRLFERFYVVDRARSRELGGTGLGLAIVKHAVAAQGGEVGVESVVGKGSRFWLWLPTGD